MPRHRLPRSLRKFLRRRKAEIRRQSLPKEEREAQIRALTDSFGDRQQRAQRTT